MERNAYFDNAKILLISLVVFGHLIQPFTSDSEGIGTLYTWIYTFHMPAFILLAGFFAKGSGNLSYILKLAKKLIIPYIIFQVMYTGYYFLIGKSNWLTDSIFYPHWSLWFLFSLFCWHLLLILYKKIPPRVGIGLALLIGILIGFFDSFGHTFSLSRTFVFFPYFLIGYWLSKEQMTFLKRKSVKIASVFIMLSIAVAIYYLPHINSGWLLASKSYSTLGLDVYGGFARLIIYATSSLMAASILAWIPQQRFSFTKLGERTLYVYLLHGFIVQYVREIEWLRVDNILDLFGIVVITVVIVIGLSSKFVVTIWQPLIEGSTTRLKAFFEKEEVDDKNMSA
ncbi:acyltransferase family protein [Pseudogracilibacillus auburnensis]|uniref:acyltransferase family protein n=1 Tax=Pseudogracilibacillus auburnensis TaxID=1494959 RepID=UPI001A9740A6|nr:acyltransferase family protein [Pseudogracilibacillus auburnensis]MBO1003653.1 acyltransferase family protein [Pseudogracilibacillus auburnensis]